MHILMFGWREGEVGMKMAALLERKLAEGVEVRVIVDASARGRTEARAMFTGSPAAGAQIVVNDVFPPDRHGLSRTASASTGGRTSSGAPTIASSTSSTGPSRGRAERGSRTTSRTAASTT